MNDMWLDANVLIRLITTEHPELFQRSLRLVERADRGEVTLRLLPMVVAEVIWVLRYFYQYPRTQIAELLLPLVTRQGVVLEEADIVIATLDRMAIANVDFLDAFLAETARRRGGYVVSFDQDFRRLEVDWVEPEL
ncbi:MAG: PIN domain-containing protein [Hormoscilla sp. GM102CHS1]|nr:PIN domain-containing protein [Hormoscilla sp. GM102CHS1]